MCVLCNDLTINKLHSDNTIKAMPAVVWHSLCIPPTTGSCNISLPCLPVTREACIMLTPQCSQVTLQSRWVLSWSCQAMAARTISRNSTRLSTAGSASQVRSGFQLGFNPMTSPMLRVHAWGNSVHKSVARYYLRLTDTFTMFASFAP